MKVLYVGPQNGSCLSRLNTLRSLEKHVLAFDTQSYLAAITTFQSALGLISQRLASPSIRLNRDLIAICARESPEIVWIDKGFWAWPSTLKLIHGRGARLVGHFTDALFPTRLIYRRSYSLYRRSIEHYDVFLTSMPQDHAMLSGRDHPWIELTRLGYDDARFNVDPLQPEVAKIWSTPLVYVGHHEPRTEAGIAALFDAGLPVSVYGSGWEKARDGRLRAAGGRILNDAEYVCALKGARIGLGFVSEVNGNQSAGRSFEIPACGTFLLAIRTKEHLDCYVEGREAEFFGDHRELVQKARYYLENDDLRLEIARRGKERCLRSGYSWAHQMKRDWERVLQLFRKANQNEVSAGSGPAPRGGRSD